MKLTPQYLESLIDTTTCQQHMEGFPTLTLCLMKLKSGYVIVGKSACIDPAEFKADIGWKLAREDAVRQLWALEGYAALSSNCTGRGELDGVMRVAEDVLRELVALRPAPCNPAPSKAERDSFIGDFNRRRADLAQQRTQNWPDQQPDLG